MKFYHFLFILICFYKISICEQSNYLRQNIYNSTFYKKTNLRKLSKEKDTIQNATFGWTGSFYSSLWIPNGKAIKIGTKPEFGIQYHIRLWRIFTGLFFGIRFGENKDTYTIEFEGKNYIANYRLGFNLGGLIGFKIFLIKRQQLDILFQVGIESFEALKLNKDQGFEYKSINSPFYCPGIGYRFYIGKNQIIMISPRLFYRFLNFPNDRDIKNSLSGNAIEFQILIGIPYGTKTHLNL